MIPAMKTPLIAMIGIKSSGSCASDSVMLDMLGSLCLCEYSSSLCSTATAVAVILFGGCE